MSEPKDAIAGGDSVELSSLTSLEQRAKAGDGLVACQLGDLYREGKGVTQDWKKAFRWYESGASLGDRDAQNNLGTMFLEGICCRADKERAIFWYRKSAEQGSAGAQWNIGKRYLHGDGIEVDFAAAYHWFSKAAVQGNTEASCEMGTMHRFGQGVERNLLAAADFHLIAAEAGDPVACGNLSEYRADLEILALSGCQMASLFLSRIYNRGFGVEASQPLTWTWILWAKKHCSPNPEAEIAGEVKGAYDFYEKSISLRHRNEGERVLIALQCAFSDGKMMQSNGSNNTGDQ